MDFIDWYKHFGGGYTREELIQIRGWCEKGIDAMKVSQFFLDNPVIRLEEVDKCVAQANGGKRDGLVLPFYDSEWWVLRLNDHNFQLVRNVFEPNEAGYGVYAPNLSVVAQGKSLKGCLDNDWVSLEPEIYDYLIRDAGSGGLQL